MSIHIPEVTGKIERRVLVGYGFEPEVIQPLMPQGITPRLFNGKAIVGLCLIRFAYMRPSWVPLPIGVKPESAAHRVGIQWETKQGDIENGVYVPEHYTSSTLVSSIGGKFFPGVQKLAKFTVEETPENIAINMHNTHRDVEVNIKPSSHWESSLFPTLETAAEFYLPPKGWSPTTDGTHIEGVEMVTSKWNYENWEANKIHTTFFDQFPAGSYTYDHTIVMRNLPVKYISPNVIREK
jgi:hypothetical protein